jgi:outer membrane protein assembly factor BamB
MKRLVAIAACAGMALSHSAHGQQYIMVADSASATRGIHLLNPETGAMEQFQFIPGTGATYTFSTPKHAMQVGEEIWVSDQVADSVFRFDLQGNHLSTISGGLDNIRGMGLVNGTIYVTNSGTQNSAPGNAVVMFDTNGTNLGFFSAVGLAPSPFDVLPYQGDILVASSSANDDIHRFTLTGTSVGTFHNSTSLNFVQQLDYALNGDILAAGFSSNNIVRLDASTGELIGSFAASGARGVYQLPGGNILWTNGSGAHSFDPTTSVSTQVSSGGFQYLDLLTLGGPQPCYANCDGSTTEPILNVADFTCFLSKFAAGDPYANCDGSTTEPILNVADFTCFLSKFAAGC